MISTICLLINSYTFRNIAAPELPPKTFTSHAYEQYKKEREQILSSDAGYIIEGPPDDDPNDPLESIIIAIAGLGSGVEHLYGKQSKIAQLLTLLNSGGFYRAIPTKLTTFFYPTESTGTDPQRSSETVRSSKSSLSSQISQTSLTESQRQIYGVDPTVQWPLRSTTKLLFGRYLIYILTQSINFLVLINVIV